MANGMTKANAESGRAGYVSAGNCMRGLHQHLAEYAVQSAGLRGIAYITPPKDYQPRTRAERRAMVSIYRNRA
jgi:hypothetical protein